MMKIVIDIPEEIYNNFMNDWVNSPDILHAVRHGTPLPKGHDRLIEAKRLKEVFRRNTGYDYHDLIDIAPTIIEGSESE